MINVLLNNSIIMHALNHQILNLKNVVSSNSIYIKPTIIYKWEGVGY